MLDLILIDDDLLIRKAWEFAAKKKCKLIKTYASVDHFLSNKTNLDISTPIYIDQELADGRLGIKESAKIADAGFLKIFLATGHNPSSIELPAYMSGIIGKKPPF